MKRREFIVSTVAGGILAASRCGRALAHEDSKPSAARTLPLTPPAQGLINVACAISKGTTEIDYVGPQAVFQTWHEDPIPKKPAPRFKIFTVSETREPMDG